MPGRWSRFICVRARRKNSGDGAVNSAEARQFLCWLRTLVTVSLVPIASQLPGWGQSENRHCGRRSSMSLRALLVGALLIAFTAVGGARAEGPRDTADLFPAQTLAYLEFRQPDRLSREMASLVRGSALDDMPAVL